jgi:uncharacterized protein YqjF (DUF2071 family)
MAQTWRNLLFAHWPVPEHPLRRHIPPELELQTFEGQPWLSVTPFVLTGLRPRALPALPGLSRFPELNVRTYVTAGGKPGVFFFSLDAASRLAVYAARRLYSLPYFRARITVQTTHERIVYSSRRTDRRAPPAMFSAVYRPTGEAAIATSGTLAHWLTERYCLYAVDRLGGLHRAEIHHAPWRLQPAEAEILLNTMTTGLGFDLPSVAPLVHFTSRLDVCVWSPEPIAAGSPSRIGKDVFRASRSGAASGRGTGRPTRTLT